MGSLKCYFCHKKLLRRSLHNHLRLHLKENPFRCPVPNCNKSVQYAPKLLHHMKSMHPVVTIYAIKCPRCPQRFKTIQYVNLHLRNKHKVSNPKDLVELKPQKCPKCFKIFKQSYPLARHLQRHRARVPKQFKCDIAPCEDTFDSKANLILHKKKTHRDEREWRSECNICGQIITTVGMIRHMESAHATQTLSCSICERRFFEKREMHKYLRHKAMFEHIPCRCAVQNCSEIFSRVDDALLHAKLHKQGDIREGKTCCRICRKKFKSTRNFAAHMIRGHRQADQIKCIFCIRLFKTRAGLKRHSLTHTGEQPYKCERCGKRFKGAFYFETHLQDHVDRDRGAVFKCPHCHTRLKNRRGLTNHIARELCSKHKPTPPVARLALSIPRIGQVQCYFCGQLYHKHSFDDHVRLHLLEMPFRCWICKDAVAFSSSIKLYRHLTSNSNRHPDHAHGEVIQCLEPNCKKSFQTNLNLNRHLDKSHRTLCSGRTKRRCSLCSQSFKTENELNWHKHTDHASEPVFSCDITGCGMSFQTLPALLDHKKMTHPMEKVKCKLCYQMISITRMKRHEEIAHLNLTSFSCTLCGAMLTSRYSLERHVRAHLGEKLYECGNCEIKFATGQEKTWHERLCCAGFTSEGGKVTCPLSSCGKEFEGIRSYLGHRKKHYPTLLGDNCYFCSKLICQELTPVE